MIVHPPEHHPLAKRGKYQSTSPFLPPHTTQVSTRAANDSMASQSKGRKMGDDSRESEHSGNGVSRRTSSEQSASQRLADRKVGTPFKHGEQELGNANQGNHDLITGKISFGQSRIQDTDILIDIGLLASGMGTAVLLEHLADLVLHSRLLHKSESLRDPAVREVHSKATEKIGKSLLPQDPWVQTSVLRSELATAGYTHSNHPGKSITVAPNECQELSQRKRSPGR